MVKYKINYNCLTSLSGIKFSFFMTLGVTFRFYFIGFVSGFFCWWKQKQYPHKNPNLKQTKFSSKFEKTAVRPSHFLPLLDARH